jgi:hypothetical protein
MSARDSGAAHGAAPALWAGWAWKAPPPLRGRWTATATAAAARPPPPSDVRRGAAKCRFFVLDARGTLVY